MNLGYSSPCPYRVISKRSLAICKDNTRMGARAEPNLLGVRATAHATREITRELNNRRFMITLWQFLKMWAHLIARCHRVVRFRKGHIWKQQLCTSGYIGLTVVYLQRSFTYALLTASTQTTTVFACVLCSELQTALSCYSRQFLHCSSVIHPTRANHYISEKIDSTAWQTQSSIATSCLWRATHSCLGCMYKICCNMTLLWDEWFMM